ncbi:unnamed protein product [Acidithrix sp. C25]|nr:unnamed protein product [Acidithrix sp. C25]
MARFGIQIHNLQIDTLLRKLTLDSRLPNHHSKVFRFKSPQETVR